MPLLPELQGEIPFNMEGISRGTTLLDLPQQDVLFTHIFSYLRPQDIWTLRLTSRELHDLCWDYFVNVCRSLSVTLNQNFSGSSLGVSAGVTILRRSKKIRHFEITSSPAVAGREHTREYFYKVLVALTESDSTLEGLCFRGVDLSVMLPLMDSLSQKCGGLKELELYSATVGEGSVQDILSRLLQRCKHSLVKLSTRNISFSLNQPLSVALLSLKHFSVSNCHHVSSEGFLEEVFRRSPLLETVDLSAVKTISSRTLMVLTEYCRHLKQLFVGGCPLVTMETLVKLGYEQGVRIDVPIFRTNETKNIKIPGQI